MPETLLSRTIYQYCKYSHASKHFVDLFSNHSRLDKKNSILSVTQRLYFIDTNWGLVNDYLR